ncbi:hypothetical protein [Methylobacterium sp. E-045]|nr:hypothetical protein [Methylobacterium sp. E-045]
MTYIALLRRLLGKPAPRPAKRPDFLPMRVIRLGRELTRGEAA